MLRVFHDYIVYNHFIMKKMEVSLSPKYEKQKNKTNQSQTASIIFSTWWLQINTIGAIYKV